MPKVPRDTNDPAPLAETVELTLPQLITSIPVFICGVNRKVNIGNFETVDVYAGLTIPLEGVSYQDQVALRAAVEAAAEFGFGLTSQEAGNRYALIKEHQRST